MTAIISRCARLSGERPRIRCAYSWTWWAIEGGFSSETREFPAGTYYVSTAQALGILAAFMLEPETNDGLVVWNYFDRYLTRQWSAEPQTYPVFKQTERLNLVKEPVEPRR